MGGQPSGVFPGYPWRSGPPHLSIPLVILCGTYYYDFMNNRQPPGPDPAEAIERLGLELRRGVIVLATLSQLDEPGYGYELQQRLAARGLDIEQGTLYPLLRRLQEQGLLEEEWVVEGSRPRKYYRLADAGRQARETLRAQWDDLTAVLNALLATTGGTRDDD